MHYNLVLFVFRVKYYYHHHHITNKPRQTHAICCLLTLPPPPQMCQILLFVHFILLRLGGIKAEIGVVEQRHTKEKQHERNRIDTNLVIFDNLIFLYTISDVLWMLLYWNFLCSLVHTMPCINLFKLHVFPCYLLLFCFPE